MKLYLVRHAETEWNVKKLMQGWKDSPLTENGINNAKRLGERLKEININNIFCSPANRAKKTAELANLNNNKISVLEDLNEMGFGSWEGVEKSILEKSYPEQFNNFWNYPHKYNPIDGETFTELFERVNRVITKILNSKDENILIVSHAVFIRAFFLIIQNKNLDKLWENPSLKDTSLSIIERINGKFNILTEWDASHCQ